MTPAILKKAKKATPRKYAYKKKILYINDIKPLDLVKEILDFYGTLTEQEKESSYLSTETEYGYTEDYDRVVYFKWSTEESEEDWEKRAISNWYKEQERIKTAKAEKEKRDKEEYERLKKKFEKG